MRRADLSTTLPSKTLPSTTVHAAVAGLAVAVLVAGNATSLEWRTPRTPAAPGQIPREVLTTETATPPRALIPVEIIRVIDGDTVEVRAHVWLDQMIMTRVRLRSIDAPELRAGCPEEARKAAAARDALVTLLDSGKIYLTGLGRDKYGGRVLGDLLTAEGHSISARMLTTGHARPYAGGKRQGWC
jgi:endonuclease YncB( thermonuclease family)